MEHVLRWAALRLPSRPGAGPPKYTFREKMLFPVASHWPSSRRPGQGESRAERRWSSLCLCQAGHCLVWFPGTSIEYDIGMVLNHVLIPGAVLRPNYPHLGLLLAVGDPIPPAVRHGSSVTGMLNIFVEGADAGSCHFDPRLDRSSRARGRETRQTLVRHNSHNDVLDLPASCDIKKDGVGATKSGIH